MSCTGERSYHLHQIEALTSNTYCWVLRCGAAGDFVRLSDEERKGNSCLARHRDTNHLGGHHPNHSPIHNGTVDAKCHPGEGGKGHFLRAWSVFCASDTFFMGSVSVPLPQMSLRCSQGGTLKVFLLFWSCQVAMVPAVMLPRNNGAHHLPLPHAQPPTEGLSLSLTYPPADAAMQSLAGHGFL